MPITDYCDRAPACPSAGGRELFVPVCQAVQHDHQKGVIHRDLKPSNVLVTLYDGRAVPKVIDFGISKATGQKLTERTLETPVGSVVGTLEYVDHRAGRAGPTRHRHPQRHLFAGSAALRTASTRPRGRYDPCGWGDGPFWTCCVPSRENEPPQPHAPPSTTDELPAVAASRDAEPRRLIGLVRGDLDWIVMKCLEKDGERGAPRRPTHSAHRPRALPERGTGRGLPPLARLGLRRFARRRGPESAPGGGDLRVASHGGHGHKRWDGGPGQSGGGKSSARSGWQADQRRKAEESAAESTAVLRFFRDRVMAAARPKGEQGGPKEVEGGLGKDATIRQALEKAEPLIAKVFAGQPLVEANIRHTLAETITTGQSWTWPRGSKNGTGTLSARAGPRASLYARSDEQSG